MSRGNQGIKKKVMEPDSRESQRCLSDKSDISNEN